jgi:hypothetical protein
MTAPVSPCPLDSPRAASVSSHVTSTMVFFSSYWRSSVTMFLVAR